MEHSPQQVSRHIQYLLDSSHIRDAQIQKTAANQRRKSQPQRWCCAACRTHITDESYLIQINGSFQHYKMNPQGHAFQFRSFKHAEGCVRTGQPTTEHSWYTGYLWQFAYCARCQIQLGWYFTGPEPFFGLIDQRIVRCSAEKAL